ncbi:MAG: hypothetical protein ABIJ97_01740 [Bacteroidota bacterium]
MKKVKKIGIIYDGETEEIIFKSATLKDVLGASNIQSVGEYKYQSGKIKIYSESLKNKGAEKIVIVTDMEQLPCYTEVKKRFNANESLSDIHEIIIVKRMAEAWFIADTKTMKKILRKGSKEKLNYAPETYNNPYNKLCEIISQNSNNKEKKRSSKVKLAKQFIDNGFSVVNAANHSKCSSAKYFLKKLKAISKS